MYKSLFQTPSDEGEEEEEVYDSFRASVHDDQFDFGDDVFAETDEEELGAESAPSGSRRRLFDDDN